jgi:hypothetical protein
MDLMKRQFQYWCHEKKMKLTGIQGSSKEPRSQLEQGCSNAGGGMSCVCCLNLSGTQRLCGKNFKHYYFSKQLNSNEGQTSSLVYFDIPGTSPQGREDAKER